MTATIIPKDCLLCDACNAVLVEEDGRVTEPFTWTTWGLSCRKHKPVGDIIGAFSEGDIVPKHHALWSPIVITDWDDGSVPAPGPARMCAGNMHETAASALPASRVAAKIRGRASYGLFSEFADVLKLSKPDALRRLWTILDRERFFGTERKSWYAKESVEQLIADTLDTAKANATRRGPIGEDGAAVSGTRQDYIYCETCSTFVDLWKYDSIADTGHSSCAWRFVTAEELAESARDCEEAGCVGGGGAP